MIIYQGENFNNLRLLFETNACKIENPDFLKTILIGEEKELLKYKFDPNKRQKEKKESEEEEKALEDKIQEELIRINKKN